MLLSLWYSDYAERVFSEMRKAIHLIPKWRLSQTIWVELHENEVSRAKRRFIGRETLLCLGIAVFQSINRRFTSKTG